MNTLHDLRTTLDHHSADVTDDLATTRVAAIRGRARAVRRRRVAGVGTAAAVVVVTAGALSGLPGNRDLAPADAPETITSLGWTYRLAETIEEPDARTARVDLAPSDTPRLVSWATEGDDQQVELHYADDTTLPVEAADFDDFAWLGPGFNQLEVSSAEEGLTLTVYELDPAEVPPGVGSGLTTFREDVAGLDLAGAAVGEPGQAELVVPIDPQGNDSVRIGYTCPELPKGYRIGIGRVGERDFLDANSCSSGFSSFDPGGSLDVGMPGPWGPGAEVRMRVLRGGEPVADGELPDLALGLAAYSVSTDLVVAAGHGFPRVIEHAGKVWEVDHVVEGSEAQLPRHTLPDEGPYVVASWVAASPQTPYALSIDGTVDDRGWVSGLEGTDNGATLVGAGQEVTLEIQGDAADVEQAALVRYRRVD